MTPKIYKARNQYETIKMEQNLHEWCIRSDEKGFYINCIIDNKRQRFYLTEDFTFYQDHQVYKFTKNHELHKILGFVHAPVMNDCYYFEITQRDALCDNNKKNAWITLYKHISYYDKMAKAYITPYGIENQKLKIEIELEDGWEVKHRKHS